MTQTEKLGFAKNVMELIALAFAMLDAAGFKPLEIQAILSAKYERAALANARQEEFKRQSKAQTEETTEATDDLYRAASGYLDAAIAAAGKGSDEAKNFQRLRSRVRAPDDPSTPVEPAEGAHL